MENIPIKELQNLANIIAYEGNVSLKNQLSAWVTSKAGNPEHASLSSLAGLAHHSSVKEQILGWVSNITNPKPEFVYVPDIPAQIIEQPKIEENAIQINSTNEVDVLPETTDGEGVGIGNTQPESTSEESETSSEEKVTSLTEPVKEKKPRKKKAI